MFDFFGHSACTIMRSTAKIQRAKVHIESEARAVQFAIIRARPIRYSTLPVAGARLQRYRHSRLVIPKKEDSLKLMLEEQSKLQTEDGSLRGCSPPRGLPQNILAAASDTSRAPAVACTCLQRTMRHVF